MLSPGGSAEPAALTSRFPKRTMDEYEALKAAVETLELASQQTAPGPGRGMTVARREIGRSNGTSPSRGAIAAARQLRAD